MSAEWWRVATDGQLLVAVKGEPVEGEEPVTTTVAEVMQGHLSTPSTPAHRIPVNTLRQWAGAPVFVEHDAPCEECGGTGEVYHICACDRCQDNDREVPCDVCKGDGALDKKPEPVLVSIDGAWFDRLLLAHASSLLASDTCEAWITPFTGGSILRLFSGDTRIVVCGVRHDTYRVPVSVVTLSELADAPV